RPGRRGAARGAQRRRAARAPAHVPRQRAGHCRRPAGAQGRLLDRWRTRARTLGREAALRRVPDRLRTRGRNESDDRTMEVGQGMSMRVDNSSAAGEARRRAMSVARMLGFDDSHIGRVAIAVSEASTNMVKHATGGRLVLQELGENGELGMAALALDHGPGMERPVDMMKDGATTTGTMGG